MLSFISIISLLNSCKKEITIEPHSNLMPNKSVLDKVDLWLNAEKKKAKGDRLLKIISVQSSLISQELRIESLYDNEELIIIPLDRNFQSANNKGKNPENLLLLIEDKAGNIRKGNIVQFVPSATSSVRNLPANFFNDYYNLRKLNISGSLTFLSVFDNIVNETKYEKGNLISHSTLSRKTPKNIENNISSLECYDVWWVTYYPDGTTTWEYMYSFCNGGEQECFGSFNSSGTTYNVGCGGGDGGEPEQGTAVTTQRDWIKASSTYGFWNVISTESFSGIKKTVGSYFTGVTHLTSNIIAAGSGYSWSASGWTGSCSGATVNIYLGGTVTAPSGVQTYIPSTPVATFSFNQIFP